MKSLLPLVYLTILILLLSMLVLFLIKQIIDKRNIESELCQVKQKIRNKTANESDYYSLGVIYLSKKLLDQAIIQFSYALNAWDRTDLEGLANLYNTIGFTYFESGQYDLSIYYYKQAIAKSPSYLIALNNLGYSYEKKKMILEAVQTYKEVLTYEATNFIASERVEFLTRRLKTRDDRI